MDELSIKIKGIRIKRGLNQEDVAKELGMTQSSYGRIESGKTDIKIERLAEIAKVFQMTVGTLIDYDETEDLPEDAKFYHAELKKAISKIEKLEEEKRVLEEDEDENYTFLRERNEELESKIKEQLKEFKQKKEEMLRTIEGKDKLLDAKEMLIQEKERTIQTMQKLIDKLS